MQYKQLPDGTQIPVLGLGTWDIGGRDTPDRTRDDELTELLQRIIRMGYTHLDTAEYYGGTHTEELVGRAIQAFARDDVFITTKVSPEHLGYADVHKSLDASLRRLQTDYVDLYLIHWPSQTIPLAETFPALNEAVADGRVRRVGVSNFDVALMEESMRLCQTPIATNQVRYNLLDRKPVQNGVLDFCQRHNILLTAYSPLKGGVLSNSTVAAIAQKHGVPPGQVAIQWLIQQPGVITIPKSTNVNHLQDNLDALKLGLDEKDLGQLDMIDD